MTVPGLLRYDSTASASRLPTLPLLVIGHPIVLVELCRLIGPCGPGHPR
jgi:hypothetical protein